MQSRWIIAGAAAGIAAGVLVWWITSSWGFGILLFISLALGAWGLGSTLRLRSVNRILESSTEDFALQREAQKKNAENFVRFRSLVENNSDLILVLGPTGQLVYISPASKRVLDLDLDNLPDGAVLSMVHPDDQALAESLLRKPSSSPRTETLRIGDRDHEWRHFEVTATAMETGRETMIIARDISEHRRTEDYLLETEDRFRSAINAMQEGMILQDITGRVQLFNHRAVKILGAEPTDTASLLGSGQAVTEDDAIVVPSDHPTNLAVETGRPLTDIKMSLLRRDGQSVWVSWNATPLMRGTEPYAVVSTITDITAKRRAQEELERVREDALQAARVKSEFLANMSHEIRTPMNGIIGMTDLLFETKLSDDQLDYANAIRSSASTLVTVINDVLDFSKMEAGKLTVEMTAIDVRRVAEEVGELLAVSAQGKGIDLILDLPPELPPSLEGDSVRLRQVLTNLVGNAVKFTEEGQVTLRARILEDGRSEAFVRFEVIDSGIGIPESRIDSVFDSFSQVDASHTRRFGGTGLGLTISKRLVELMGGSIGVESQENTGSTFWVEIAFAKNSDSDPVIEPGLEPISGKTALVVIPNSIRREVVQATLTGWGLDVEAAESSAQALLKIKQSSPICILIDSQCVGETEWKALRNQVQQKKCEALLISPLGEPLSREELRTRGFSAGVSKPVRRRGLLTGLRACLSLRDPAAEPSQETQSAESPVARYNLLLVEDNIVNQKVASKLLTRLGHQVTLAVNGREAVEAVQETTFDCILMDVQMPEMDGLEATRVIREQEAEAGKNPVPIIAMTAHALQGDKERCLDAGMNNYISKPVQTDRLRQTLEDCVEHKGSTAPRPVVQPVRVLGVSQKPTPPDAHRIVNVINDFMESAKITIESIRSAAARGDHQEVVRCASELRDKCIPVGAGRVGDACRDLEAVAHDSNKVDDALKTLEDRFATLQAYCRVRWLDRAA